MKTMLLCGMCGLLLAGRGYAQTQVAKTDSSLLAANELRQKYSAKVGHAARLYNGPEYVNYVKRYVKGHQFFESAELQPATIEYEGATYTNVPLRYDLVRGQVVVKAPLGALEMLLVEEHVKSFSVAGHSFIHLAASNEALGLPRTGFYDLLLDGPVRVLVGRRKEVQERSTPDGQEGEVLQKDEIFLSKAGSYYKVGKASTVLAVFPENKAALRRYIQDKKLKFKAKTRQAAIVELMRYQASIATAGVKPADK